MTQIQITELSNLIYKNLTNNYSDRKKQNIIKKYFSIYFNLSYNDLLLNKSVRMDKSEIDKLNNNIQKINQGIPIQYVLKKEFFFNYLFTIDESVLIPRPETEELVSKIIKRENKKKIRILEIGVGSGCIAITLKKELSKPEITAIDISKRAVKIAQLNAQLLNADLSIKCIDFFEYKTLKKFDVIISNPPYIAIKDKNLIDESVLNHEPKNAFFVSGDPLKYYKKILKFSFTNLNINGRIYFEINSLYKDDFEKYLAANFSNVSYAFLKDMQGDYRFLFLKF